MKKILPLIILLFCSDFLFAQSNPLPLDSQITTNRIMTVQNGVIRLARDPISKNLFYIKTSGQLYEVLQPSAGAAYDSLVYSTAHHGVQYVQGMAFYDSTLYISGNNNSDSAKTVGIIARGKLMPDSIRKWDTLMITQLYQTADYFDHLFSGIVLNRDGDTIYICSGARGDHGEVQTRYGAYPNLRNVPLTTKIYALPTHDSALIILPGDSAALDTSGYVFCRGVRNHFDMAFDANGNLFGLENSGDRDHNEEMNWLQKNHHYGFPWKMGDTDNPQQFASFVPANDKLINHFTRSWRQGFWNNDPTYPHPAPGQVFDAPIQNFGPDCDKYRDTTGAVHDASDSSLSMGTFTAHRSPLGLVFDNAHVMATPYTGDAFMLSWTKGYDTCGCTTIPDTGVGPFVDPSQDLVHLHLEYDSAANNFRLNATRIIAEFQHPVDADIDSNKIYVIENGYGGTSGLYEVIMPVPIPPLPCNVTSTFFIDDCNPDSNYIVLSNFGSLPNDYYWHDTSGTIIIRDTGLTVPDSIANLPIGQYYVIMNDAGSCPDDTLAFVIHDTLSFHIDSVRHTTCIACADGVIYFSVKGGVPPYTFISSGVISNDSVSLLPSGNYQVCANDQSGCSLCDSAMVLEDPTGIILTPNENIFAVYPNPVQKAVTLIYNGEENTKVRILNTQGSVVKLLFLGFLKGKNEISIDCSGLQPGSYTIELTDSKYTAFRKIILIN